MIAEESNNDFCFDLDTLSSVATAFEKDAQALGDIKDSLILKLDNLKYVGWKSEAGKAFFKQIDDGWTLDIQMYVDLMNNMAAMIRYAANQFEDISNQAKLIRYEENLTKLSEFTSEKLDAESIQDRY